MKKTYSAPQMEIIEMASEGICAASSPTSFTIGSTPQDNSAALKGGRRGSDWEAYDNY